MHTSKNGMLDLKTKKNHERGLFIRVSLIQDISLHVIVVHFDSSNQSINKHLMNQLNGYFL